MRVTDLRKKRRDALDALATERKTAFTAFKAIAEKAGFKPDVDQPEFDRLKKAVEDVDAKIDATQKEWDAEIARVEALQALEAKGAQVSPGQEDTRQARVEVSQPDPWTKEEHA